MAINLVDGWPSYRSVTQDELYNKLQEKYEHFPNAYLTLSHLNRGWVACYGVERWLSKVEYIINKEPEKYRELKELLMAGWNGVGDVSTLSVLHVFDENQPVDEIFKKLVKSREGLTRCLNNALFPTRDEFLKNKARAEVINRMKKTGKPPKQSTLEKYGIDITSVLTSPT